MTKLKIDQDAFDKKIAEKRSKNPQDTSLVQLAKYIKVKEKVIKAP